MTAGAQAEKFSERVVEFDCRGARLVGVFAKPSNEPVRPTAVLIAVGGPQYRVGSHRQFVLLARRMARAGYPVLRFDYRGMGDSEGAPRSFDEVGDDMHAALDALCRESGAERIVVFGLCDAASAALIFATEDPRVRGLALVNPWVRSNESLAATHVRHYYGARLLQPEFWGKVLGGQLDWRGAFRSFLRNLRLAHSRGRGVASDEATTTSWFQDRMAAGLTRFPGRVLLILSGNDLTAREFTEYTRGSPAWSGLLDTERIERVDLPQADHTFSSGAWRGEVADRMLRWLSAA
jgi:exosortase A-associated hydrolase 1